MGFADKYHAILEQNGLSVWASDIYAEKFELLTKELLSVSEHTNLTALKTEEDIIAKHYADSMMCIKYIPEGASFLDVGTGAGFPSLPVAMLRPDVKVTALDSTGKKLEFVASAAKKLGLENLSTVNMRAEDAAKTNMRESFDAVCARAVARLNVLSELCVPFVKVGGLFISMKGASGDEELKEAEKGIERLGGRITGNDRFELVSDDEAQKRSVIIIQKETKTPAIYPRNYSQINKKPL